jgi:hypothetical protein
MPVLPSGVAQPAVTAADAGHVGGHVAAPTPQKQRQQQQDEQASPAAAPTAELQQPQGGIGVDGSGAAGGGSSAGPVPLAVIVSEAMQRAMTTVAGQAGLGLFAMPDGLPLEDDMPSIGR